jgi:formylglycine-generating enzyme required for sulfatase activity
MLRSLYASARLTVGVLAVWALWAYAFGSFPRSAAVEQAALGTRARCAQYDGIPAGFPEEPAAGMVWIGGGSFTPGSQRGYPEERGGVPQRVGAF